MRNDSSKTFSSEQGFSVLEMIIVLLIVSLTASVAYSRFGTFDQKFSPTDYLEKLTVNLSAERARALHTGKNMDISFDLSARTITGSGFRQEIPSYLTLTITIGQNAIRAGQIAVLQFRPDGSSSGAEISAFGKNNANGAQTSVDWLTGSIRMNSQKAAR